MTPDREIFRLSPRAAVELSLTAKGIEAELIPPEAAPLTPSEIVAYRAARDAMVKRLASRLGIPPAGVLVVEVWP